MTFIYICKYLNSTESFFFFYPFVLMKVLEAQMKVDLADKENLEARRAQHEEESRENSKLISEQKAVSLNSMDFFIYI